jgi:acetyltransferase-like isoleucine patch superfamily enzyme
LTYVDEVNNVKIVAGELLIGDNVKFGRDIDINVRGTLSIGNHSYIGDRFKASAEEISIGEYFYNSPTDSRGMIIGGGGSSFPFARLKIGDRVVCHTGFINLAAPITIGDDVGLSHDVDLLTHGFWYSVLEGYPRTVEGITLGNNVIVGWKSVIMAGVTVADNVVIGAHSTLTKSALKERTIYAGTPAAPIKYIEVPSEQEKHKLLQEIVEDFKKIMTYYRTKYTIEFNYPFITVNALKINAITFSYQGEHDDITDAFRDFVRRYGIRVYAPQGFRFNLVRK